MSCWAASMRMILAWGGRSVASDDEIAAPTGHASSLRSGLHPNDGVPLKHWGFRMNAPQTYTEDGIRLLLRSQGPLWIACDVRTPGYSKSVPHIRVIRGMREAQSPFALMINDPGPVSRGSQYDETYVEMVRKNELLGTDEQAMTAPIYVAYLTSLLDVNSLRWLHGWWAVWDGNTYYYHFGTQGTVQYIKTKPRANSPAPTHPVNQGTYSFESEGVLVINWKPVGGATTRETFWNAFAGKTTMNANSNRYSPLVATKIV
jgi:hypothetical protein